MIKKTSGGYKVTSESGKNLGGPYKSKTQAQKRLRQVEFFKHHKRPTGSGTFSNTELAQGYKKI